MPYEIRPCQHGGHGGYACDKCGSFPMGNGAHLPPAPFGGTLSSSAEVALCDACYWDLIAHIWRWFGHEVTAEQLRGTP